MKKAQLFAFAAAGVVCLLTACGTRQEEKATAPVRVKTEVAAESNASAQRTYVGVVEEESSTAVSFTGSGTITHVYVSEGQRLGKGQPVAELDKTQALNMLRAAEAQMKQANDAYGRMKQLYDNNALPEIKWVETQSKLDEAKAQLDLARKNLSDRTVHAPVGGVVGSHVMQAGETALPAMPVATILNINNVKVKVSVPEREIAAISEKTRTRISVEALGETFEGGRIEKGVEADAVTHTYDIRICVPNRGQRLLPGMVCEVEVKEVAKSQSRKVTESQSLNAAKNGGADTLRLCDFATLGRSIYVPITAVQQGADGENFVWTVVGNKAHRQRVQLGEASGNRIAILSGVSSGDVIITEGFHRLSEGTEVKDEA